MNVWKDVWEMYWYLVLREFALGLIFPEDGLSSRKLKVMRRVFQKSASCNTCFYVFDDDLERIYIFVFLFCRFSKTLVWNALTRLTQVTTLVCSPTDRQGRAKPTQ